MRTPALFWIVTCKILYFCSGHVNITLTNGILRDAIKLLGIADYGFECALNVLDGGLSGVEPEDMDLNVTEIISKYNYPVEEIHLTTEDDYILTVLRMKNDGPPIFLMHGFLSSADDFVTMNLPNSIAYTLWSEGYDVWMGNARGNKYSRKHVTLDPDTDKDFWDFSWDEIGRIDLPTMIDYILETTGESQIVYIGHSQGTTTYYVMCSEKPEYNDKVALMISLSPVAYMSHLKSPSIRLMAPFHRDLISKFVGVNEVLPSNFLTETFTSLFCNQPQFATTICANLVFILCGFDCAQVDVDRAPVMYGHLPSGSSTKQLVHYLQEVMSGKFQKYDYGLLQNFAIYGSLTPPDYDLSKITSPVALFYGDNDWLSSYLDVKLLIHQLPNVVDVYRVPFDKFSHLDFLFAKDASTLVHPKLLELVKTVPNGA